MTDPLTTLSQSRALWNFAHFDFGNDEALAQILDRGSLEDWRALYALMGGTSTAAVTLRARVRSRLFRVPTGHPWFWLAALESLGDPVETVRQPRLDDGHADVWTRPNALNPRSAPAPCWSAPVSASSR